MSEHLEQILGQLLVPDSEAIRKATAELKEIVKDPGSIPALCLVLSSSQNPQVRQYAAVLLRRRILKAKQWRNVSPEVASSIRQNLLQVMLQEPEKSVRKALSQLVATVAKHDLPGGHWPELFQFLQQYTRSENAEQREIGMYVLSTLASVAYEQLQPHTMDLLQLCSVTINDQQNIMVPFHTVQTLTHLVAVAGSGEAKAFQALVPQVMTVIKLLISVDQEKATEAMEILDELVECEVTIVMPHIRPIIEFCLEVGANKELSDGVRVKALSFVSWLTRLKKKTILKYKLIQPILSVLFPILCEDPGEEEDEDDEGAEASTPSSFAAQVIDVMALHLPPEKFIPSLMKLIEASLQHEDQYHRKAAYIAMAVAAEGCADHLRTRHLKNLLQCVYKGLSDPSPVVRNAALFALGQFSEHLQPDISKYSSELLPILFDCLGKASQDIDKDPRGVTKTHYALEMFVENLEKEILPYLPQLMQYLITAVMNAPSSRAKELAISSISAVANSAKEEFVPYFGQVIEMLKGYLSPTGEEEELKVQIQALECLGVLARTLETTFQPLAMECVTLGLSLVAEATDPDLRRCIYGLFASTSGILKTEMAPHLEVMVRQMIDAMKSTEGVTAHFAEEESQMFRIFDEDENLEEAGEEEEDDEVQGFSVENAYLDEKEDACQSLGDLALHTGVAFMPYVEETYKEVTELLDYPSPTVRKVAVVAVSSICIAVAQVAEESKSHEAETALFTMLSSTVPKTIGLVREDADRQVAMVALDSLNEMIQKIKAPIIQCSGSPDVIPNLIRDVLVRKIACQDQDEDEGGGEEEDEEAEYDTMLVENAGELLPSMAKVVGGQEFCPYVAGLMPELLKRLKPSSTIAEKSFAVGTLADTMDAIGPSAESFASRLFPLFMSMSTDSDEEVRSNAVFALGILSANGGEFMKPKYPTVLRTLFDLLEKESDKRVMDNICAATCRMIMANIDGVPMDQVFPTVMQCLPLKEDLEENATVIKCLGHLYTGNHPQLVKHLPQVLSILAQVLGTEGVTKETEPVVVQLVQDAGQRYPEVFTATLSSIPVDQSTKLQHCLQTVTCNGS